MTTRFFSSRKFTSLFPAPSRPTRRAPAEGTLSRLELQRLVAEMVG